MITEIRYRNFQKRFAISKPFRYFWTFWGNYAFLIFVLAWFWIFAVEPRDENLLSAFGLSVLAFLISRGLVVSVINLAYKKARPYQQFKFEPAETRFFSFRDEVNDSFPSRHTIAYFSVASVVVLFYPSVGLVLLGSAVLAGIGRVVMGWHWPLDILAGMVIGSLVGYATVLWGSSLFFT